MCPVKVQGGLGPHSGYAPSTQLQGSVLAHHLTARTCLIVAGYRFKSFDAARAMANANPNEVSPVSPTNIHETYLTL